jgi:hypothetical protein
VKNELGHRQDDEDLPCREKMVKIMGFSPPGRIGVSRPVHGMGPIDDHVEIDRKEEPERLLCIVQ